MKHNLKVIYLYSKYAFETVLRTPLIFLLFFASKLIRLGLFIMFLSFLFRGTYGLLGYDRDQVIFFFLTFSLIDTTAQLLFREVYRFRSLVVSGNLDMVLIKPFNPLLRVLLGGPDPIDLAMWIVISGLTIWFANYYLHPSAHLWISYIGLVLISLIIATCFHIFVLGLGVITTSVDHLIMIYRDLTSLLRIPVDLYIEPLRFLLTFIIPLGIMFTFPAQALMGLLSTKLITISLIFTICYLFLALKFWNFSLRHYQSASS